MFVRCSFGISSLHYTYGCAFVSAAFVCKHYIRNHWDTQHLWVCKLNCSLCLLGVPTQLLGYTTLIGVEPELQPMFFRSTYIITGLNYTYRCATFS